MEQRSTNPLNQSVAFPSHIILFLLLSQLDCCINRFHLVACCPTIVPPKRKPNGGTNGGTAGRGTEPCH